MKAFFAAAGLVAGASAAVVARGDQCCFQLTASGGASGSVGQYTDGQNRIGGGYPAATYCIDNGKITDKSGRGCILTPPTTQFQCDVGATPSGGFSVSSSGELEHAGSGTFWACPYAEGAYNIYTSPVPGQDKCVQISLSTGGTCAASSSHSTWVSPPTTKPKPMPSGHTMMPPTTKPAPPPPATTKMAPPPPPMQCPPPSTTTIWQQAPGNTCPPAAPPSTVTVWKMPTGETCPPATCPTCPPPSCPPPSPPSTVTAWSTATVTVKEECSTPPVVVPPPVQSPPPPPEMSHPPPPPPMSPPPPPQMSHPPPPPPMSPPPPPEMSHPPPPPPMSPPPPPQMSHPPPPPPMSPPPPPPAKSSVPPPPPVWHNSSMPMPPPTSTKPTPPSTTCPGELTGQYQTPHLIVPIKSSSPDQAYGTQYTATISETECSIFNFDIPASYSGMQCQMNFLFPEQSMLETSSYTLSGSGSLNFWSLKSPADQSTTWNTCPAKSSQLGSWSPKPGSKYSPWSGSCAAGTTVSVEVCATESLSFTFFEDWNPCPIGLFMSAW